MPHDKTHASWQKPCGMSFAMPWPFPWGYSKTHGSHMLLWYEFCHAITFPMGILQQPWMPYPGISMVFTSLKPNIIQLNETYYYCQLRQELLLIIQLKCPGNALEALYKSIQAFMFQHNCVWHCIFHCVFCTLDGLISFFFLVRKYDGSTKL